MLLHPDPTIKSPSLIHNSAVDGILAPSQMVMKLKKRDEKCSQKEITKEQRNK